MTVPTFRPEDLGRPEVRAALDEVGAIHVPGFATAAETGELRRAWQELSDDFVARNVEKVNGTPIKYGRRPTGERYVNRFAFASQFSEPIHRFVTDSRFDAVRHLCGADMRISEDEKDGVVINCYRNEEGSRYKRLGWHTDGLRDVFLGKMPGPMYNVGFYLDDSPVQKGALRLLPGTHKQGVGGLLFRKWYFVDHSDDRDEVILEAKAGDLTIHDGRLWHRVGAMEWTGDQSTRRTMYIPCIDGPYKPKSATSPTPLYHRLQRLTG